MNRPFAEHLGQLRDVVSSQLADHNLRAAQAATAAGLALPAMDSYSDFDADKYTLMADAQSGLIVPAVSLSHLELFAVDTHDRSIVGRIGNQILNPHRRFNGGRIVNYLVLDKEQRPQGLRALQLGSLASGLITRTMFIPQAGPAVGTYLRKYDRALRKPTTR